jgi:dipeptidyl aminopeptidase/acylaminoacyl peptidase
MPGSQRVASDCRHGAGPFSRVDRGRIYFPVTERGCSYLYAVDGEGNLERVISAPGSIDAFDVHDGKTAYIALRETVLQEVYVLEGQEERQLTHLNERALADRVISIPEPFTFETEDGTGINAWLMKPAGFAAGKQVPGILYVHGGPKAASGSLYYHELQILAGKGYAVFFCNPRGSAGCGDAFGDLRGMYGTVDYDDLMAFVDHVLETFPFVDPERLGVMGHSYGGFMTNWIIGHTDRFRAACSHGSISNWHSFFCGTDLGYYFTPDQIGATPWEDDGKKLWWHSPLRYAHRAKTPTLFINSDKDYMCWPAEGIQMFSALRYHGVESRLILFHGENHDLSETGRPLNRLGKLREVMAWFDQHL